MTTGPHPTFDSREVVGTVSDDTLEIVGMRFEGYVLPNLSSEPVREGVVFTVSSAHGDGILYHTYEEIAHLSNPSNYERKDSMDANGICNYCGRANNKDNLHVYMVSAINPDEIYDLFVFHETCKEHFTSLMSAATDEFSDEYLATEV